MRYIVLDLEWNQPLYPKRMIKHPVILRGEIIQIGAVKLDEDFNILDTFKILVTPKYYKKMHKKVSELTKITLDDLQYGFPFHVAFAHFSKWCGTEFSLLTWGMEDYHILKSNMLLHKLKTDWIPDVFDIQLIFSYQRNKGKAQLSLSNAMKELDEEGLEAHDALNDARNTARICTHLDLKTALREYSAIRIKRELDECDIGKVYASKLQALEDPNLLGYSCPSCGGKVHWETSIKQKSDKYISIGFCESGERFFVRLKFSKRGEDQVFVSRIIYELDEENLACYMQKKREQEEKIEKHNRYLRRMEASMC